MYEKTNKFRLRNATEGKSKTSKRRREFIKQAYKDVKKILNLIDKTGNESADMIIL